MNTEPIFTKEQLPPDRIMLIVKANTGEELASVLRYSELQNITEIAKNLISTIEEIEGSDR